MKNSEQVQYITTTLNYLYKSLPVTLKDIALETLFECQESLKQGKFEKAHLAAQKMYIICGKPPEKATTLFHGLLFAEDVLTSDSTVFINTNSPYLKSLNKLSNHLGFKMKSHDLPPGNWTKDYLISAGSKVLSPLTRRRTQATPIDEEKETAEFMKTAQNNEHLYYGKLQINAHHTSKVNIKSSLDWWNRSQDSIGKTQLIQKVRLEGGNFFCAINKSGKRFYLVGENVISETMKLNHCSRSAAIDLLVQEIECPADSVLIVPQWTYHLDLQMAYLGQGQFIIHSFEQDNFDLGISAKETSLVEKTFAFLAAQFEKSIINATCQLLETHGFEVKKVFGCLFYVENLNDLNELSFIPYCKSSDGFDGALALLMNGITYDSGLPDGRHFLVSKCDLTKFVSQFETSIRKLGVKQVHAVDMLDGYDWQGDFSGTYYGVFSASSVSQIAAIFNGALRCQTSIISDSILSIMQTQKEEEYSNYLFFKPKTSQNIKASFVKEDEREERIDPYIQAISDVTSPTSFTKERGGEDIMLSYIPTISK